MKKREFIKRGAAVLAAAVAVNMMPPGMAGIRAQGGGDGIVRVMAADEPQGGGTEENNFEYTQLKDGTVAIVKYLGGDVEVLDIPAAIDGRAVTAIRQEAFSESDQTFVTVNLPETVVDLDPYVFVNCPDLREINVASGNTAYMGYDGCVYTKEKKELVVCPIGKEAISFLEGVTAIKENAAILGNIREVTIPATVREIGGMAFGYCRFLLDVAVDDDSSLGAIGIDAFAGTPWLADRTEDYVMLGNVLIRYQGEEQTLTLPSTFSGISGYSFSGNEALQNVTVPGEIRDIPYASFEGCSSLESVTLQDGVKEIGEAAFISCDKLSAVTLPASLEKIGGKAFGWSSRTEDGEEGTETVYFQPEARPTIHCYADTVAHNYAVQNGLSFELFDGSGEDSRKVTLDRAEVKLENESCYFDDGAEIEPEVVSVQLYGTELEKDVDYQVSYRDNTDVGEATVLVTGIGNYKGQASAKFEILEKENENGSGDTGDAGDGEDNESSGQPEEKIPITDAEIELETEYFVSDGTEKKPEVLSVRLGGELLVEGTDYEVSYENNIAFGPARVIITGIGKYKEFAQKTFFITPPGSGDSGDDVPGTGGSGDDVPGTGGSGQDAPGTGGGQDAGKRTPIDGAAVQLAAESFVYDGGKKEPAVLSVTLGGVVLVAGTDYQVVYADNTAVGTAVVFVTGIGAYTGSVQKQFTITAAEGASIKNAILHLSSEEYSYSGKPKKPDLALAMLDSDMLVEGTDYELSYGNNVNIGTATVTIKGIGKYTGTVKKTFKIVAKDNGIVFKVGKYKYTIRNSREVEFAGVRSSATKKVSIPASIMLGGKKFKVASVAEGALKGGKVTSVVVGDNVQRIGKGAFSDCLSLRKVTLGKAVASIGEKSLERCGRLEELAIRSTKLRAVGKNAFNGIPAKTRIKVPARKLSAYKKLIRGKGKAAR